MKDDSSIYHRTTRKMLQTIPVYPDMIDRKTLFKKIRQYVNDPNKLLLALPAKIPLCESDVEGMRVFCYANALDKEKAVAYYTN